MHKLRILYAIRTVDSSYGGPVEHIRQIGHVLTRLGHKVEVATLDDPADPAVAGFPFEVFPLGPGKGEYGYSPKMVSWLTEQAHEYDGIFCNGIWQFNALAVYMASRRAGFPYWIYTHGMLDPYFNKTFPLKSLKKRLYWLALHRCLGRAESLLFTSEEERLLARGSFRPYRIRETVIPYGTSGPDASESSQREAFLAAAPSLTSKRFLLYLGRIHPKKGLPLLLTSFAEVYRTDPDMRLVVAGPGEEDYVGTLRAMAEDLEISDRTLWPGMLKGDAKWGAFRCAEAFVLTSHQENFGIAVAEALACGTPVLITKPVNIWREIEAHGAGYVEPDTEEGAKSLLSRWQRTTPDERQKMQVGARECFSEKFNIEAAAKTIARLIDDKQKRGRRGRGL